MHITKTQTMKNLLFGLLSLFVFGSMLSSCGDDEGPKSNLDLISENIWEVTDHEIDGESVYDFFVGFSDGCYDPRLDFQNDGRFLSYNNPMDGCSTDENEEGTWIFEENDTKIRVTVLSDGLLDVSVLDIELLDDGNLIFSITDGDETQRITARAI